MVLGRNETVKPDDCAVGGVDDDIAAVDVDQVVAVVVDTCVVPD